MARTVRDPVTFEVFRNAISGLADQMALTVLRTAHSQIVAESMDFSTALCDSAGRLIAQANTISVHLGSTPEAMAAVFEHFGTAIKPGDVYILNDPDLGGMHLPDIFVIEPVHVGCALVGFAVAIANHADVGGWAAGSMAVQSTSIFAEGIQIPPSRLIDGGVLNETLLAVITRNCREPELFRGDLESQFAACHAGAAGLRGLVERHGERGFEELCADLLDYSETLLLAALAEVRPGEYAFEDAIDDDGLGSGPIPLVVRVSISPTGVHFDFTGSSPQVASALNATSSFTKSGAYAALQGAVGRDIPPNAGFYRPLTFTIPRGTILNPIRPAARGARGMTGLRVLDLVLGALAPAFPDTVPAGSDGSPNTVAVGITARDGRSIVIWDILCGAWGARPTLDGLDGASSLGANLANTPVEEMERSGLVRIDGYGYLPDTGGPGRFRGGLATFRDMALLYDHATLRGRSDRRDWPPHGLHGGRSGTPSANILNPGGDGETLLPTKPDITIVAGDRHRHVTASGGGYGDPLERDPSLVLEDVLEGKVTVAGAARDYGVIVRNDVVDHSATAALRASANANTSDGGMDMTVEIAAELKGVEVTPGVTLRYWEAGQGRPLVMLPGLGHAASLYKFQIEGLSDEFRILALDPRAHGESDKPRTGYNYHTLAKDLDAFLRALDLRDVTILGHSGGCKIILTYWELYGGERLRSIVFSDDSPCHLRDGIFSAQEALAAIDAFDGPDAIAFSKGFSDQFLTDAAPESAKQAFYTEGLKLPRPYMAKLFRWAAFGDWWDAFSLIDVPALVIGGRASKVPLEIAARMHRALPGSRFVVFEADEGGGHAMFWEGPEKYNDTVRSFMRSA